MGTIGEERITLKLDIPVKAIIKGEIICCIGGHARAGLEVLIPGEEDVGEISRKLKGGQMCIHEVTEEDSLRTLFLGYVERVEIVAEGKYITAKINGISYSAQMDGKEKYCSYQNTESTYRDIVDEVAGRTRKATVEWNVEDRKTGNLLVQYGESDWEFLKRVASRLECPVLTDEKSRVPNISIGIRRKQERRWDAERIVEYEKGMDRGYYLEGNENKKRSDYLYYAFHARENYDICDWFTIDGNVFFIARKSIFFDKAELSFSYRLVKEQRLRVNRIHNRKLKGITLEGTIVRTERENVFLQLDIDEAERAEYAFWWEPVWGNMVYCMPECGERAAIRFHAADEGNASAGYAVRGNGGWEKNPKGMCHGFGQYQNRVFETEQQKQMGLVPDGISLKNRSRETPENHVEIKDKKGISVCTDGGIRLAASGRIIFYAKRVISSAPQEIRLQGMDSSIQINRNFNVYSPNGIEHCGLDGDMRKPVVTNSYKESRKWVNNYHALAAIPAGNFGNDCGKTDAFTLAAVPSTANGMATYAMCEMMEEKEIDETSFPQVFDSMEVRTMNGGFPPPDLDDDVL